MSCAGWSSAPCHPPALEALLPLHLFLLHCYHHQRLSFPFSVFCLLCPKLRFHRLIVSPVLLQQQPMLPLCSVKWIFQVQEKVTKSSVPWISKQVVTVSFFGSAKLFKAVSFVEA